MLEEYMLSLGYSKEIIDKTKSIYPLCNLKEETLLNNIKEKLNFLQELGFNDLEIKRIFKIFPQFLSVSNKKLNEKIEYLISLGFTKEEVLKIFKKTPSILSLKEEFIIKKINTLMFLGHTKQNIIKMITTLPIILIKSIDSYFSIIKHLISLGFTEEETIKILSTVPSLYANSNAYIESKFNDIINLGYTKEETLNMVKKYPAILTLKLENIKDKKEFYESIGISNFIIIDTKNLMQSLDLTYARYQYYQSKNIEINMTNYKLLFVGSKYFLKKYGLSNETILKKYNYQESKKLTKK